MTPEEVIFARLRLGMTLRELAEALRMGTDGRRAVRRWETGDRPISGPASVAIEAMLGGWRPAHIIETGELA
jgi:transcriptional regulator with XRE-family HTH domain